MTFAITPPNKALPLIKRFRIIREGADYPAIKRNTVKVMASLRALVKRLANLKIFAGITLGKAGDLSESGCMKAVSDYAQKIDRLRDSCPVKAAIDVIRGRWKPGILFELNSGTKRFSDLQSALPGIAAQALTVQLRQLEADGVVVRKVYPEIPPRVEYALSRLGQTLSSVMEELEVWGTQYLARENNQAAKM